MTQQITKAIIPVAGWGTRRLPITKTIEKCMLPIGNRPLVDYVVQDCLAAGITDLYFVVGEQSTQLRDYYRSNIDLNDYLVRNGKESMLPLVAPLAGVKLHYVVQPSYGKYGTAIPVALASEQIDPNERVVVLMGDDFIFNRDGSSETKRLIDSAGEYSAMLGVEVPREEVSRYGVIKTDLNNNFVQIVEKPTVEDAPSNLINVSKYVLDPVARQAVEAYVQTEQPGEYYITEPLNNYVSNTGIITVTKAYGEYLDGGTVEGWLRANTVVISSK
jgi:UTP--glucose-1-phosphate uridylyltransferase